MTQSTRCAAGSFIPKRTAGVHAYRNLEQNRSSAVARKGFISNSLYLPHQNVTRATAALAKRWYNRRFTEESLYGVREVQQRFGFSRIDAESCQTETRSRK